MTIHLAHPYNPEICSAVVACHSAYQTWVQPTWPHTPRGRLPHWRIGDQVAVEIPDSIRGTGLWLQIESNLQVHLSQIHIWATTWARTPRRTVQVLRQIEWLTRWFEQAAVKRQAQAQMVLRAQVKAEEELQARRIADALGDGL